MDLLLKIGGVIFWAMFALFVAFVALIWAVGFVRAVSLHAFLCRARRATDGKLLPFKEWTNWPYELFRDSKHLAGLPFTDHGVSFEFPAGKGMIEGQWNGVGDWWLKKAEQMRR